MNNQVKNPLSGYFRQPAIYLQLPSQGKWWPEGSLDMPENMELPVYPMTAKDEILIRTPDALLNGQGVVDVVQSCCPNIKNAWGMPSIDTDAVLIAIRIATFGNGMGIKTNCTHCGESNEHEIDLGGILEQLSCPDFSPIVTYKSLKIKLRPQAYKHVNRTAMIQYEEQKLLNILNDDTLDDEHKMNAVSGNMKRMVDIGIDACVNTTEYIEMPDGDRVNDKKFLKEFFENSENDLVNSMQKTLGEIIDPHQIKPVNLICANCSTTYSGSVSFDFANFFARGF